MMAQRTSTLVIVIFYLSLICWCSVVHCKSGYWHKIDYPISRGPPPQFDACGAVFTSFHMIERHSATFRGFDFLVIGGYTSAGVSDLTFRLNISDAQHHSDDPSLFQWSEATFYGHGEPGRIRGHSCVITDHRTLFVLGGNLYRSKIMNLDFLTHDFTNMRTVWDGKFPPQISPDLRRMYHTATAWHKNSAATHIVLYGGIVSPYEDLSNEVWILDATDLNFIQWDPVLVNSTTAPYRFGHVAAVYNDYLYVFGGIDERRQFRNELFRFDLVRHRWSEPIRLKGSDAVKLSPRSHMCATFIQKTGKWYIFGGKVAGGTVTNDLFELDLNTMIVDRVKGSSSRPPVRFSCAMAHTPDHKSLVLQGGINRDDMPVDTWRFFLP